MDPAKALPYERINDLLDPGYHEVETGYCILENGAGYVAVNNVFPGCTVDMMKWWFAWHAAGPGLRYALWFPPGHVTIAVSDQGRRQAARSRRPAGREVAEHRPLRARGCRRRSGGHHHQLPGSRRPWVST